MTDMTERYEQSLDYLARARRVTPGGAQTLSKMAARFPEGAFPAVLKGGCGAKVVDVDDHIYVDWICALGAVTLGYHRTELEEAVTRAIHEGACYSLPTAQEITLCERLTQRIPCAEMVRLVSSGSEATEAAIRTARIATGRDVIATVQSGYHSWHSWFQAVKDWHPGVPDWYRFMVTGFEYNDTDRLRNLLETHCLAAVILEPTLFTPPATGFLETVRDLCTQHGTVLIFDEMVTGYRWTLAGGSTYFGVTPDLATYGKAMANGLPIGMLCGRRDLMSHAELISGTFGGNAVSVAAAHTVLDLYEREPIVETMWHYGRRLQDHLNQRLALYDWAVCDGYPVKPRVRFTGEAADQTMALFLQECAAHGVLLHPSGFNVSAALTDEDLAFTFHAIDSAVDAIVDARTRGDWSALKGQLCRPVVTVRTP